MNAPTAPFRNWSELQHGTLNDFVMARHDAFTGANLEQFQAAAVEYAGHVHAFVNYGDGFHLLSPQSRHLVPVLKKLTRRAIEKYVVAMKIWQLEILSAKEQQAFVSAVFVWEMNERSVSV